MRKIDFLKKSSGRPVSLTNLAVNGNFASTAGWTSTGASFSVASNEASYLANSTSDLLSQVLAVTNGRKYYACGWTKAASGANITMGIGDGATTSSAAAYSGAGSYQFWSVAMTSGSTGNGTTWAIVDNRSSGWNTVNSKYITVVDLTAAFGSGNEPTRAQMDGLMLQFTDRWLDGTKTAIYTW